MAGGRIGQGWYGPDPPAAVTIGGGTVNNNAMIVAIGQADLGADIAYKTRRYEDRRLTKQFAGSGDVKYGDTCDWELPMIFKTYKTGTRLQDADKTPLYAPRRRLRITESIGTAFDLNAVAKAMAYSNQRVRKDMQSALLPLAIDYVMSTTRLAIGDYTYSNFNTADNKLYDPGGIPETTTSAVRDGAKLFREIVDSMELRGVLNESESLHAVLTVEHSTSMALETLSPFNPSAVVTSAFRTGEARGMWYGSNITKQRLLHRQQIGSLDGAATTGAIRLKGAVAKKSTTRVLDGFGNSKTNVIYAGVTLSYMGLNAVDPQVKHELTNVPYQEVILPREVSATYEGEAAMKYEYGYGTDSTGAASVTVSQEHWYENTGNDRNRQNVSGRMTDNLVVGINGVLMSSAARINAFAGKTQSMSYFYKDRSVLCAMVGWDEVGPGVSVIAMTTKANVSTQVAMAGDIDTLDKTTRCDLGYYGKAMSRTEFGSRLGGKTN